MDAMDTTEGAEGAEPSDGSKDRWASIRQDMQRGNPKGISDALTDAESMMREGCHKSDVYYTLQVISNRLPRLFAIINPPLLPLIRRVFTAALPYVPSFGPKQRENFMRWSDALSALDAQSSSPTPAAPQPSFVQAVSAPSSYTASRVTPTKKAKVVVKQKSTPSQPPVPNLHHQLTDSSMSINRIVPKVISVPEIQRSYVIENPFEVFEMPFLVSPFELLHDTTKIVTRDFFISAQAFRELQESPKEDCSREQTVIQIRCFKSENGAQKHEWPKNLHISITVNSKRLDKIQRRPVDVSDLIRQGNNQCVIHYASCATSGFQIVLCKTKVIPDEQLIPYICEVDPKESLKLVGQFFADEDDEIAQVAMTLTLKCPISFQRIKLPSRGSLCKHVQCFDLQSYFSLNRQKLSWHCPVCNEALTFSDLRVDRFFSNVLENSSLTIDDVELQPDGSFSAVDHKARSKKPQQSQQLKEASTHPAQQSSTFVDLDDDDEDDENDEEHGNGRGNLDASSSDDSAHVASHPISNAPTHTQAQASLQQGNEGQPRQDYQTPPPRANIDFRFLLHPDVYTTYVIRPQEMSLTETRYPLIMDDPYLHKPSQASPSFQDLHDTTDPIQYFADAAYTEASRDPPHSRVIEELEDIIELSDDDEEDD
eukprot:TRINITY_DN4314_c0_g2_i1.p1 TRINITY_DN4314_c0_g2~~TRINITY_DN4314_c0_g2_i1.p1  ORF type:complete len:653 (-),score=126.83 TRINITY_DN4314_c0_g2_i1:696-2654(-)